MLLLQGVFCGIRFKRHNLRLTAFSQVDGVHRGQNGIGVENRMCLGRSTKAHHNKQKSP